MRDGEDRDRASRVICAVDDPDSDGLTGTPPARTAAACQGVSGWTLASSVSMTALPRWHVNVEVLIEERFTEAPLELTPRDGGRDDPRAGPPLLLLLGIMQPTPGAEVTLGFTIRLPS